MTDRNPLTPEQREDLAYEAGYESGLADREPRPTDGPDFHADHAAWKVRAYPANEPYVIDLGQRHFVLPVALDGYLWHHDGPTSTCHTWGWFGVVDGKESGHRIVSHEPLTVEGSLIHPECGDHGLIRDGRWRSAQEEPT